MSTQPAHMSRIGVLEGLSYPLRGARMVYRRGAGFARYWIPPIVLSAAAMVFAAAQVLAHRAQLVEWMWAEPDATGALGWSLSLLHGVFAFLVTLASLGIALVLALLVSQVVAAPFYDALSEAVERAASGRAPPAQTLGTMLRDGTRAVLLSALKLLAYASIMLPLWLLSVVLPAVGPAISSVVGFVLTIAFLALDHLDWAAARHGLGLRARVGILLTNRGACFGFGLGVWLLLFVPLLNLLLLPAAVAGGTLMFLDVRRPRAAA